MYYLYKRYEKRIGAGKWPEIIREYVAELPPILETSQDINDAVFMDLEDAKEIASLTCFDFEEVAK